MLTQIDGKRQVKANTLDVGRLEANFLKSADWNPNAGSADPGTITGIPDPVNPLDVVNKQSLELAISTVAQGNTIGIGASEDGLYTDGLYQDFAPTTSIGTAIDRFNEVLGALAPTPAPVLSNCTTVTTGASAKLSFDTTSVIPGVTPVPGGDINSSYTVSGNTRGVINAATAVSATLAADVMPNYTNSRPHPNQVFGDGDKGTLRLTLNGATIHTVDLTTFGSGSSLNAQGSGFVLTAANSVKYDKGTSFDMFKYRGGTVTVSAASMTPGYNVMTVVHEYSPGLTRTTNVNAWVVDADVTATAYSVEALSGLSMTGAKYLSGVAYHTAGTLAYAVTIKNGYKNTYSPSATALSYTGVNCAATAEALPAVTSYADDLQVSGKAVTINATRLTNGSVSLSSKLTRSIQASPSSTGVQVTGILLDSVVDSSTAINEMFDGEAFRIHSDLVLTNVAYGAGTAGSSAFTWDSTKNLLTGGAGYDTGLLVSGGELTYPKVTTHLTAITAGDFSAVANGPVGNPNYNGATGNRTYLRYFYTSAAKSNFKLSITCTSTAFVSVAAGPSANNLTCEILAPNTTKNAANAVVWKDAAVNHSGVDTDVGCYAATFGNTKPTNWGLTLGAKNTSTSGKVVVVRITAGPAWTGKISNIALTWL